MMLPPDGSVTTYDVVRGTCPRCGSGSVTHLIIGLMAGVFDGPEWALPIGCVHPGHDRECEACGLTWSAGYDDESEVQT